MYYSFALAGHRGTCLRPLHIFALLCFCFYSLQRCQCTRRKAGEDGVAIIHASDDGADLRFASFLITSVHIY